MEVNEFKKQLASGKTDFEKVCLAGAKLQGLSLNKVRFVSSCLKFAQLDYASLNGAVFYKTSLAGATFINTNLREARLVGLEQEQTRNLDLSGADLTDAILVCCDLSDAKLDKALIDDSWMDQETLISIKHHLISLATNSICNQQTTPKVVVNNQGIPFYPDSPIYQHNGLRYRSKSEIAIAKVLEEEAKRGKSIVFYPNNLGRFNDSSTGKGVNREADFLIIYKGNVGILEVDGPYHTPERRVDEMKRERIFKLHGIKVIERFDALHCYKHSNEVVKQFLEIMDKIYN